MIMIILGRTYEKIAASLRRTLVRQVFNEQFENHAYTKKIGIQRNHISISLFDYKTLHL